MRLQPGQRVVISHNTITTPGTSGKAVLTIRAAEHITGFADYSGIPDTQYVYVSDNHLIAGTSVTNVSCWAGQVTHKTIGFTMLF